MDNQRGILNKNHVVSIICETSASGWGPDDDEFCRNIARRLKASVVTSVGAVTSPYAIQVKSNDITLHCLRQPSFKPVSLDFDAPRRPVRNDPLIRAIGKNARNVIDVTAGWCDDTLNLVYQGYNVTAIEQNDVVMEMLVLAREKAKSSVLKSRLQLVHGNSVDYLVKLTKKVCVVYLDPMYPQKTKSARPRKNMQVLQDLVGHPVNEEQLLLQALGCATQRVVVKRPHVAPPLIVPQIKSRIKRSGGHKVGEIKTKLVRFDIYKPFEDEV
ncbi:MAG: hypothetical protein GKR95_07045 [Gammaproteobacteria bacterium]|nr:hypothetical protein [Gammaproteobacteria bacterium]